MTDSTRRDSPGGSFHDHYESLVERAAAGHALPTGGMTPREQCRALEDAGVASPEMLRRLSALLERCVYGQTGSEREHHEGIALCAEAASTLPLPERDLHERQRRRNGFGWMRRVWPMLVPILALLAVIALAIAIGYALMNVSFSRRWWRWRQWRFGVIESDRRSGRIDVIGRRVVRRDGLEGVHRRTHRRVRAR